MAFVKLDCGILNSSVWAESVLRDVFLTALLMAEPYVTETPLPQLHVRTMDPTGWVVPPGWYGFVPAAGIGIIRRALVVDVEAGIMALEHLGATEVESRSQAFEGRRLVRVDGGYIALNFDKYRERDLSGAERQRRYRMRKASEKLSPVTVVGSHVTLTVSPSNVPVTVTEAEAEAEAVRTSSAAAPLAPSHEIPQEQAEVLLIEQDNLLETCAQPVRNVNSLTNTQKQPVRTQRDARIARDVATALRGAVPSHAQLLKVVHAVCDEQPGDGFTDLKEAAKGRLARLGFAYDAASVGQALERVLAQRAVRRPAEDAHG